MAKISPNNPKRSQFVYIAMPIKCEIIPEHKIVISVFTGIVDDKLCLDYLSSLKSRPDFDPSYSHLSDMSGVTENQITEGGVQEMAESSPFFDDIRRAFIFADTKSAKHSSIYKQLKEAKANNILVTDDREKAYDWLLD